MSEAMPPSARTPSATGTFEKTPFAHLLIFALDRALSGVFEFAMQAGAAPIASLLVAEGKPAGLTIRGMAPPSSRAAFEAELAKLFAMPETTLYSYFDGETGDPSKFGEFRPIDPFAALWRGVRLSSTSLVTTRTLDRVGASMLRLAEGAQLERFALSASERDATAALGSRPMGLAELTRILGADIGPKLAYTLIITRQVELVEPSARQNTLSPPARALTPAPLPAPTAPSLTQEKKKSGEQLTTELEALRKRIIDRAAQITGQNYFEMLGIPREAPIEAAQKAYISLAKEWHPDRLPQALSSVKDASSKVFSYLSEAHATLKDPQKREQYIKQLASGLSTPDEQAKVQTALEAASEFQKAEFLFKRNPTDPQGYALVKRALELDPGQLLYRTTLLWLDSQKPGAQANDAATIRQLDACIRDNPEMERAYMYRAHLHKRSGNAQAALKDFRKAVKLNPHNVDALREVRLFAMRESTTPDTSLGGLLGKLFKK